MPSKMHLSLLFLKNLTRRAGFPIFIKPPQSLYGNWIQYDLDEEDGRCLEDGGGSSIMLLTLFLSTAPGVHCYRVDHTPPLTDVDTAVLDLCLDLDLANLAGVVDLCGTAISEITGGSNDTGVMGSVAGRNDADGLDDPATGASTGSTSTE